MNNAQLILTTTASTKSANTPRKPIFKMPSHEDCIWVAISIIQVSVPPSTQSSMHFKFVIPIISTGFNLLNNIAFHSGNLQFENYNQAVADTIYSIGVFAIAFGAYAYSPPLALAITFAEIFLSSETKVKVKEPIMDVLESVSTPITAAVGGVITVAVQQWKNNQEDAKYHEKKDIPLESFNSHESPAVPASGETLDPGEL